MNGVIRDKLIEEEAKLATRLDEVYATINTTLEEIHHYQQMINNLKDQEATLQDIYNLTERKLLRVRGEESEAA